MNPQLLIPFSWSRAPKFASQVDWWLACYHNGKGPDLWFYIPSCWSRSYCPKWSISVPVRRQTWQGGNPNICVQEGDQLRDAKSPSDIKVPEPKTLSWGNILIPLSKDTPRISPFICTGVFMYMSHSSIHYCSSVFVKSGIQTSKFRYKGFTES